MPFNSPNLKLLKQNCANIVNANITNTQKDYYSFLVLLVSSLSACAPVCNPAALIMFLTPAINPNGRKIIIAHGAVPKKWSNVQPIPTPTKIATTNSVDSLMALPKLTLSDFFPLELRFWSFSRKRESSDFNRSSSGSRWSELGNTVFPEWLCCYDLNLREITPAVSIAAPVGANFPEGVKLCFRRHRL